jgi:flagella basal body P-ring formation protein FlgA
LESGGETTVARAPRVDETLVLDAATLLKLANRHRIDWRPLDAGERSVVARAARTVEAGRVEAIVGEALGERLLTTSFEIELSGQWPSLRLPADNEDGPVLHELALDERSGRFSATLGAGADTPPGERLRLAGRVVRTESLPMPSHPIAAGAIIREHDLEWRTVRLDRLAQDPVLSAEAIVGKAARRALKPGLPVREADLLEPLIVHKGSAVTMIYRAPGLELTMLGRALEDGAAGQSVRVLNPQSRLVAVGAVAANGTVVVGPPGRAETALDLSLGGDQ